MSGAEPRRHAEALLRAAVGDVDTPAVDVDGDAAERRDAVDQQERVALAGAERLDVVAHAGRRLRVHDGDDLRRGVRGRESLWIDGLAPLGLDSHYASPATGDDIAHALAEHAVDADHDDVAGADDVDERRLHARRAGAADRQGERVGGAEHGAQPVARLVEQREEVGIEVPEQRARERLGDLWVRIAGAGTHEHAVAMGHDRSLG